jgi:hypothetical protein
MQKILIVLILVVFILSLLSHLDELKKNPTEFIKKKFKEFFIVSTKDRQKIGTSSNDLNNNIPKSQFKVGNTNYEGCYSTETRSGNVTQRNNTFFCNQGIDGGEVIPMDQLYTIDFQNYNIHYGKIAKGIPLRGAITNANGNSISLGNNGEVLNNALNISEAKSFCDHLKDKCHGFIAMIPTKNSNVKSNIIFLSKAVEGWEDPDTYIKMSNNKLSNSDTNSTNTNYISYIKKDVNYTEKSIEVNKLKSVADKYINLATCNWKSNNRCIFKDYTYNPISNTCKSNDNKPEFNIVGFNQDGLNQWLTQLANRDLGNDKLTSEEANVREYINRCKEVDGYEFLSNVTLPIPYVATTKPGDIKGRYVRISINNTDPNQNWLQLAEVQVISNNRNIAIGKNTSGSGNYPGSTTSKANDGNNDGNWNSSSVYISGNDQPHHPGSPQFWEVDLGDASQTIDRIIVSNRTDGGAERLNKWLLSIYDNNKKLVWARIYPNHPNPKVIVDIKASDNDLNNIRIKDYEQTRFNKYFNRVSDTEFKSKQVRDSDCDVNCHKTICEGEKKKWIGNNSWYGCRDYKPGELEAELAEKARLEEERNRNFKDSDHLTIGQKAILQNWLPPNSKPVLIYKGSRDGMNASAFHNKVNGKGATITILKNSFGHTIGGYTSLDWGSAGCYAGDTSAFLFSLDTNRKFSPTVWSGGAVCAYQPYGPTFGGGHDLMIFGWMHNGNDCYHNPHSFDYQGARLTKTSHEGGSWAGMFKVVWIETYQVTGTNSNQGPKITVYEHGDYQGRSLELGVGTYDYNFINSKGFNDQISSMKVPQGLRVEAWQHDPGHGTKWVWTSDTHWVGDANDTISSIIVSRI